MNKITKLQNYKIAKLVSSTTNVGGHWVKNKMKWMAKKVFVQVVAMCMKFRWHVVT